MDLDKLLRLAADQSQEHAVLLLDPKGNVVFWSKAAERVLGYSSDEMLGQPVHRLFVPEDIQRRIPEFETHTADARDVAEDDRWMLAAGNVRFWAEGAMTRLQGDDGETLGYSKLLRNRTDLKELLERYRSEAVALAALDQQRSIFIGTLAHELRNSLAPLASAQQLLQAMGPTNAQMALPLKLIERQIQSLKRLVDDLLDLTRIDAGKVVLRTEPLDLRTLVQTAVESMRPSYSARDQELKLIMVEAPVPVIVDADRIQQVMLNLLGNASKFSSEKSCVAVTLNIEGNEAVIKVDDQGQGIAPTLLPKIFDLFTQASTAESKGGLGIGLSLVKHLVTLHGGTVQARSEGVGKGSRFTVRLPLAEATKDTP